MDLSCYRMLKINEEASIMKTLKHNFHLVITLCLAFFLIFYLFFFAETYLPFLASVAIIAVAILVVSTRNSDEI